MKQKEFKNLPNHIAFIMDGNGRWGLKQGKSRTHGHKKGLVVMKKVIESVFELQIPYVSFYAFSIDNWNRSSDEVSYLHNLIKNFYQKDFSKYKNEGYRLLVSGVKDNLEPEVLSIIDTIQKDTKHNEKGTIHLCFNYGGRLEIVNAAKEFCKEVLDKKIKLEELNQDNFYQYLFNSFVPPVDFLVRTSGEKRISDFLLYQSAYAEFYFTSVLWPEFGKKNLHDALKNYEKRQRRFGKEESK